MTIYRCVLFRKKSVLDINVGKINTHNFIQYIFSPQIVPCMDNMKHYDTAKQATDKNMIGHMRITCWIRKTTTTHSEYEIFLVFPQHKS